MKPRARRVTMGAAVLALALIAIAFMLGNRRDAWLLQRGRVTRVERDARQIYRAASEYRTQRDDWPRTLVDIIDADTRARDPRGGCESYPRDPWGSEYSLAVEQGEFVVTSFGRDRRPGGVGEDADLVSVGGQPVSRAASHP